MVLIQFAIKNSTPVLHMMSMQGSDMDHSNVNYVRVNLSGSVKENVIEMKARLRTVTMFISSFSVPIMVLLPFTCTDI